MKPFAGIITSFAIISSSLTLQAGDLTGSWTGQLKVTAKQSLKLVFHIGQNNDITMDSPDQGAYGIECETVYISEDSVNIKVPNLMVNFAGHLVGNNIEGIFKQGFMKLPLVLEPGEKKVNRPQTPVAPFPYTTEEVRITNRDGDATLAGTLTIPDNVGKKTPIVVLVTGSGLQNRDEELFEHKPFAVIADYLARNGVASLRYDDRGFGESTGNASQATTADFASDANAVIDWIRELRRFGKVGIIGHSEGGQIAYMLGAKKHGPDFIISIAGPSIKGSKTLAYQNKNAILKSGISAQEAEDFETAIEKVFEFNLTDSIDSTSIDSLIPQLYPQYNDSPVTRQLASAIRANLTSGVQNPWLKYFLAYDPANDMKHLKIPTLIIYGEKDRQVPASLNAAPARKFASKATVKEYPDLNHLMQHAGTGDVEEYHTIEETFSPDVLSDITNFIKSLK